MLRRIMKLNAHSGDKKAKKRSWSKSVYLLLFTCIQCRSEHVEGEDGEVGMVSSAIDSPSQEEILTPLARLQKDLHSDNVFNRQMVARSLLDTLRSINDDEEDKETWLEAISQLSEDIEPMVRAELMEQIPHIAMLCREHHNLFPNTVQDFILPTVVRYLMDTNNQVRKTSQAALLVLLEQELVSKHDMEDQVCPVIVQLSSQDSCDDYRTEAVALMSKVAPLVGKEITEKYFLPQFTELCKDSLFHIRKVCAANFGDICSVVGEEATEAMLLPRFEALCSDSVWGVRKACAECFMSVSWATSKEKRERDLSSLFVLLLRDQSRWVRMAAFQALGPFISTFADPSISGVHLMYNADGTVQIAGVVPIDEEINNKNSNTDNNQNSTSKPEHLKQSINSNSNISNEGSNINNGSELDTHSSDRTTHKGVGHLEFNIGGGDQAANELQSPEYDSFLFWRQPVPIIGVKDKDDGKAESASGKESIEKDSSVEASTDAKTEEQRTSSDNDARVRFTSSTVFAIGGDAAASDTDVEKPSTDSGIGSPVSQESRTDATDMSELVQSISNLALESEGEDSAGKEVGTGDEGAEGEAGANAECSKMLHVADISEAKDLTETVMHLPSTHALEQRIDDQTLSFVNGVLEEEDLAAEWEGVDSGPSGEQQLLAQRTGQNVIPSSLLENFLSMTDPRIAQAVDTEIAKHCAYSLPGVALTLGRRNWPCLREIYDTLASDMQWKVRRTLAFSIHQMALILGDEITTSDLVPIFNGFLKDLDEVRIGVLKHFADFVKLLKPDLRRQYLNRMTDFLTTDNQRNWRFRLELAEQLVLLCDLYDPSDVCDNILPIALTLAGDRVADVRFTAYKLLSVIVKIIMGANDDRLRRCLVQEIVSNYAQSERWARRQAYCHLCQRLLHDQALEPDEFAQNFLPSLLQIADDPIPNVRITLARSLTEFILPIHYFENSENPCREQMRLTLSKLQKDEDRDVRFFASPTTEEDVKVAYAEGELPV